MASVSARAPLLSKSQYMRGLQCPKALWLYRNRKDLIPQLSPIVRAILEQGHEVGRLARLRYPNGHLIGGDHTQIGKALSLTRQALSKGLSIVFEPAALSDGVFARADMLTHNTHGGWDLIEVKGAIDAKDAYLHDVALQRYVFEGAGIPIRRAILLLLNNEYVRRGPIDVQELFVPKDVTRETARLLKDVKTRVEAMREVAATDSCPEPGIGDRCHWPHDCAFKGHCWKDVPSGSIYDIRLSTLERKVLEERGIMRLADIPEDFALLPAQRGWVEAARAGRAIIDREAIADLLGELRYPLYFLDFEAINPAIPPYDGLRPFRFLPFQASLHIQEEPGDPTIGHAEYLGDPSCDPRPGLVEFLSRQIGPRGSLVVYNKSFEGFCLDDLAQQFPRQRNQLASMKERLWDLSSPFRRGFYLDPRFNGSWSLKAVLPALIPEMDYGKLAINDGAKAQVAYLALMRGELTPEQRQQIERDLKAYCGQDTWAMVRLLSRISKEARA